MYEKWTQTKDFMRSTTEESNIYNNSAIMRELKDKPTLKKEGSRKMKKSVIPKSNIKRISEPSNVPEDIIFSPGDKRTTSKLHSSTMKKSNTMGVTQTRAPDSFSSSNRFLFRGNEEFHNTVAKNNPESRRKDDNEQHPFIVRPSSKSRKKDNHHK